MSYRFDTTVTKVERRKRAVRARVVGTDKQIEVEYEDLGWFIVLAEFGAAIHVGNEEPEWKPGRMVSVRIEAA